MSHSVALVGAGPTAIYSVQALLASKRVPAAITIFERQRRAGQGTPYSANWSDPIMLANIASIEIPLLPERLIEWLEAQSNARLASFGIARQDIEERAFYPRLVVGEYLAAQLSVLMERARAMGVKIDVRTRSTVSDVRIMGEKIELMVTDSRGTESKHRFDYVILATGHQWPPDPEIRPGYFTSPWPATALARIRNCAIGIRGSSLTAIDAAVALADQHGEFVKADGGELQYRAQPATEEFSITLFSRKGILPEADFYHPIPYQPLSICNAETMQKLIADSGSEGLLDAAFELFRQEMKEVDASYADALGLTNGTLEEFGQAYFDARAAADPFEWAKNNLEEAAANAKLKLTVAWRYAILRMHEVFGLLPPHLGAVDFERFSDTLKPVFVDNYATVPHESVKRLLALHAAKKLVINRLDDGIRLDTHSSSQGALLMDGKDRSHFPVFIEATGQPILSAKDFPFPSLLRQGVIRDMKIDRGCEATRGIAIDGDYHPISMFESSHRLFCLSLPFLLGQHPFAQGITSSAEMAEVVADAIDVAETADTSERAEGSIAMGLQLQRCS
jgi:uncharacterized NAD(P)/FAD-binding protein YdhS